MKKQKSISPEEEESGKTEFVFRKQKAKQKASFQKGK